MHKIDIKGVRYLGGGYLIKLNNSIDKQTVMKNKYKLKNIVEQRVFISDDMSKEEREIQAKIRVKAKEEKDKGQQVKIGFQKVIVNNDIWKWNKAKNIFEKQIERPKN